MAGNQQGTILEFEKPIFDLEKQVEELKTFSKEKNIDMTSQIAALEEKIETLRNETYSELTVLQRIQIARHPKRPTCADYIEIIFDDFLEMHGDRLYRDDPAMIGGIARLNDVVVTVVGQQKGRDTKENILRNFGSPHPDGYRKALRLMKQAEKFGRPIICLVDVVGAFPGVEAEERGQGEAIARSIMEMADLKTPIIVIITGEGGSGGALAVGVGNRVLMLENAYYSVISPEGCAAILWKDATRSDEAAKVLKLSAADLSEMGMIDQVIPEPIGGAHRDPETAGKIIKDILWENLQPLLNRDGKELRDERYQRFRGYGKFSTK